MSRERRCTVALYKTITNTHLYTKHSVNDHNFEAKVNDAGRELVILGKTVMSKTFPQMVEKS
jgi:hypothetical protein